MKTTSLPLDLLGPRDNNRRAVVCGPCEQERNARNPASLLENVLEYNRNRERGFQEMAEAMATGRKRDRYISERLAEEDRRRKDYLHRYFLQPPLLGPISHSTTVFLANRDYERVHSPPSAIDLYREAEMFFPLPLKPTER